MKDYEANEALSWFHRIEQQVLEVIERLPPTRRNENLPVPFLVTPLLDACGLIDSLFRDLTPARKKDKCNICDFGRLYAAKLKLLQRRSLLLVSPPRYRQPFRSWAKVDARGNPLTPTWWKAHNKLKHDRLANLSLGTLGAALDAVAALHQLFVARLDLLRFLIRRGWLGPIPTPEALIDAAKQGKVFRSYIATTALFATPDHERPFPDRIENILLAAYECDPRLNAFLGRT